MSKQNHYIYKFHLNLDIQNEAFAQFSVSILHIEQIYWKHLMQLHLFTYSFD